MAAGGQPCSQRQSLGKGAVRHISRERLTVFHSSVKYGSSHLLSYSVLPPNPLLMCVYLVH